MGKSFDLQPDTSVFGFIKYDGKVIRIYSEFPANTLDQQNLAGLSVFLSSSKGAFEIDLDIDTEEFVDEMTLLADSYDFNTVPSGQFVKQLNKKPQSTLMLAYEDSWLMFLYTKDKACEISKDDKGLAYYLVKPGMPKVIAGGRLTGEEHNSSFKGNISVEIEGKRLEVRSGMMDGKITLLFPGTYFEPIIDAKRITVIDGTKPSQLELPFPERIAWTAKRCAGL